MARRETVQNFHTGRYGNAIEQVTLGSYVEGTGYRREEAASFHQARLQVVQLGDRVGLV